MTAIDEGLLSPASAGHDDDVSDAAVLAALIAAEVALIRAWATVGAVDAATAEEIARALAADPVTVEAIACAAVAGGNPVIPLVAELKARVPGPARAWVHRGATSQDIVDSALMLLARDAVHTVVERLARAESSLADLAAREATRVAAGRTLTQHAVPTTVGLRVANWLRGIRRAADRLGAVAAALPAQLGGAGGTLASFVEIGGADAASRLPAAFADALGLAAPEAPWHTDRSPVTSLGDALVGVLDALGKMAADVATLSRTEIGEVVIVPSDDGSGYGGSSAMPQKQNPVGAVLIRSAAIRAPQLGATLHLAAALAVDERPDGAWHAEWPTLRELLRLALGASSHAAALAASLGVDDAAVVRDLALTKGLIVSERLGFALTPLIGKERFTALIAQAAGGEGLAELVRALPEASALDVDALLDPSAYTGLAAQLVRDAVREDRP